MTVECPGGGPVGLTQDGAISSQHSSQLATRVEVHLVQRNSVHYNRMCIYILTLLHTILWRMEGNRLVRMVMLEAMGLRVKVKWIEKLKQSLEEIGWMGVEMEELGKLSNGEVVQMLRDCV